MKAVLKYPGGKWRIAEWVIAHFPAHSVYLEPYFGSGAIFFTKAPAGIETVNDLDGDIVNLFRVCRERGEELARLIELTRFHGWNIWNVIFDQTIRWSRRGERL